MKQNLKNMMLAIVATAAMVSICQAQTTKYDTSSTGDDPSVVFGPASGGQIVKALSASVDVANGGVKLYTRAGKYAVSGTNSTTIVNFTNPSTGAPYAVNTNDVVVYVHANGTLAQTTVSAATSTNVTLAAALTVAYASGDYLYELSQSGQIVVGASTTAAGTNATLNESGDIFYIPGDSPLYVTSDCATNGQLQVSVR